MKRLKKAIKEANQNNAFNYKLGYWLIIRKRNPDPEWLLEQLKLALGPDRLLDILQEEDLDGQV
jgi:hypothetical protein